MTLPLTIKPDVRRALSASMAAACAIALSACATVADTRSIEQDRIAIEQALMADISVLASNEFEGRKPGTAGEAKTLDFMENALKAAGFESGTNDPANPWRAPVTLIDGAMGESEIAITMGKRTTVFGPRDGFASTTASQSLVEGADLVFAGRLGESVDDDAVRGKVAIIMGEEGKSPARRQALFDKGAAAVLTVLDSAEDVAGYRTAFSAGGFSLPTNAETTLSGYVAPEALSKALGENIWTQLRASADGDDFELVSLDAQAMVRASSNAREVVSYNLIGRLPGTQPDAGAILLLGHWDHFGECGEDADVDRVCNGAVDNASGIAAMLELARRLTASGPHNRDIYVMGTTAEEWGLLGARAFVNNPPVPLDTIVAALNYDSVAIAPRGSIFAFVGEGRTHLDELVLETVDDLGLTLGNQIVAEQFIQRLDSWALLEAGVPAITLSTNFGSQEALDDYLAASYHKAGDEIDGIELGGAVDDVLLHLELVRRAASVAEYPANGE